jgi:hypothetical protein
MFAFGVTRRAADGERTAFGAGANGKVNDNDGELPGRPEFRRGRGELNGKPMDGPNGLTGDVLVRITCAMAAPPAESQKTAARNADAMRLMAAV